MGLATNKEEDEGPLLSSEGDRVDGNCCAREKRFVSTATHVVTQKASSSSTSSTTSSPSSTGGSATGSSSVASSEAAIEGRRTTDAYVRLESVVDVDEPREHPPSTPTVGSDGCSCCCHKHSSGQTYWSSDDEAGAFAHFSMTSKHPATASPSVDYAQLLQRLHGFRFQVILGADGRRNTLADHFPRKEFRGRLAIAITANFANTHTLSEAQIPEISGISFIYNQQLFRCVSRGDQDRKQLLRPEGLCLLARSSVSLILRGSLLDLLVPSLIQEPL